MDIKNKHKVSKRKWNRWSEKAKEVFNTVRDSMKTDPELFWHPKQPKINSKWWDTTTWNAAWIAADAVDEKRVPD